MSREIARRRFVQLAATSIGALGVWGRHTAQGNQRGPNQLDGVHDYIEKAMARWGVPGLAIAVIKEGRLILSRGYGVRTVGTDARVDAETVFPIASCTKPFTAAAIAKLLDDGRLQWDDVIAKHLPELQFSDAELTSKITIRHALTHRTGLPTANMLWRSGAFDSDEILARLRWLRPATAPGEHFLYNNNMYLVLGKVVGQVSGRKWSDFVRNELFEPLSMKSTLANSSAIQGLNNVAAPHASDAGKVQAIQPHCPDEIAPAGAIHSNVLDMAHWLRMHLQGGQFESRQVLSPTRIEEMHTAPPRTLAETPGDPKVPRAPINNYGLGWFFNDYAGRKVVEHSGTQNGFVSWVAMMPEERLGLVVLANHHRTGLNSALRTWIFDACLGRPERDWSEDVRTDYATGYQRLLREAKAQFDAKRPPAMRPLRPLSEYAGLYESQLYGCLRITAKDDRLALQFGTRFEGEMEHWRQDAFRTTFGNPRLDDWMVTFAIKDGHVASLRVKESPWAPAWYDDDDDLGEFLRS
jgi:CubicO group peptidase (beta-lactamase class C family)